MPRKRSSIKSVKKSERTNISGIEGESDSEDSNASKCEVGWDMVSDCDSDKEEGPIDGDKEESNDFESDDSGDDSSLEEEIPGSSHAFVPIDVPVEPFDTSTLRSHSSAIATAKVFPTFEPKRNVQHGPIDIPIDILQPWDYVKLFWDDGVVMKILVENTNKFGAFINRKQWKDVTIDELWTFFGIVLFTGLVKVPERRLLWQDEPGKFGSKFVKTCMARKRFEDILQCLHWLDTSDYSDEMIKKNNKEDCFWRVSELEYLLSERFQRHYACGQDLDVDEQGIPAKCRHSAIQYNKNKPYKYFFKLYCLNDSKSKYLHNFYLYRGKGGDDREDIPASALPVIKLTETDCYQYKNHIMYVDNYFNSISLCSRLLNKNGIHVVGTVRTNRIPKTLVSADWFYKKGKKTNRGAMKSRQIMDDLFVTTWYDKKPVNLMHTFATTKEMVERNSKNTTTKRYEKLQVQRPTVVRAYNEGMGGTDSFDQRLSYYRPSVNTKRWPHRVIFHLFLCSVINAHILYKEVNKLEKHKPLFDLFSFVDTIIDEVIEPDLSEQKADGGGESAVGDIVHLPLKRQRVVPKAATEIADHIPYCLPSVDESTRKSNRLQCNNEGCTKKVSSYCTHCHVALCLDLVDGRNCWMNYHQL